MAKIRKADSNPTAVVTVELPEEKGEETPPVFSPEPKTVHGKAALNLPGIGTRRAKSVEESI